MSDFNLNKELRLLALSAIENLSEKPSAEVRDVGVDQTKRVRKCLYTGNDDNHCIVGWMFGDQDLVEGVGVEETGADLIYYHFETWIDSDHHDLDEHAARLGALQAKHDGLIIIDENDQVAWTGPLEEVRAHLRECVCTLWPIELDEGVTA